MMKSNQDYLRHGDTHSTRNNHNFG